MTQNEQIEGIPFSTIREAMGLMPFEQYEALAIKRNRDAMTGVLNSDILETQVTTRGTGRTTKMLCEAVQLLSRGKKVAILVPNELVGRDLIARINTVCERVFQKTGVRVHNLAKWVLQREHIDQNDTLLEEHTYEVDG